MGQEHAVFADYGNNLYTDNSYISSYHPWSSQHSINAYDNNYYKPSYAPDNSYDTILVLSLSLIFIGLFLAICCTVNCIVGYACYQFGKNEIQKRGKPVYTVKF